MHNGELHFSQRLGEWRMYLNGIVIPCNGEQGTPHFNVADWNDPRLLRDMMRFRYEDGLWWKDVCPKDIVDRYKASNAVQASFVSIEEDPHWTDVLFA
jgi:hypothetical protein